MKSKPPPIPMVTVATQTDDYIENEFFSMLAENPSMDFYLNGNSTLMQPSSRQGIALNTELGLSELELANTIPYTECYEDGHFYDVEYEEVTLHRSSLEEKVGLTLCYGSAGEVTDVFVSEIEPDSIAGIDGHIREGDQILQINGVDVHSREQAINLFAESRADITLFLARPQVWQVPMDDGFEEHLEMLHQQRQKLLLQTLQEEDGGTTDTATTENLSNKHEDSGVGRTDESTKYDESSEQEMLDGDSLSMRLGLGPGAQNGCHEEDMLHNNDSFMSGGGDCTAHQLLAQEADKFRDGLEARCSDSPGNSPSKDGRKDSQSSIEREIALLNKEMEFIQIECEEIVEKHLREQEKLRTQTDSVRSPRMVPRMGTKMDYNKQLMAQEGVQELPWAARTLISPPPPLPPKAPKTPEKRLKEDRDTSTSAYNTADSLRSTPLTMELSATLDEAGKHRTALLHVTAAGKPSHSDSEKAGQYALPDSLREWSSDGDKHRLQMPHKSPSKSRGVSEKTSQTQTPPGSLQEDKSLQELYTQYADVMYTNRENLEHTMKVQQKLFEQQLMKRAQIRQEAQQAQQAQSLTSTPEKEPKSPSLPGTSSAGQEDSSVPMEWVVKRRADGSRYITRRPIRAKMLKERAKKIIEERCGMTTDDDAMSEMKLGRYWSKEDRRRHLEKARDHKRKKEFLMKSRMETVKEGEEGRNKVLELSHRKMMKHKGRKVLDNFTTVQEMVAHGSKDAATNKNYNPLLSVTTV